MCVARTLIFWTASHTLVLWSMTMVGHVKKSYGRLAWLMVLWTCSAQVSGVVGTCADGQRLESSSRWWFLSYCMAVRHAHWTPIWRGKLLSLIINVFTVSWSIAGITLCETESRFITSIVHQRQRWLYGYVARYLEADPACWIVSERDNLGWRRPRGRPQNLWLGQVDVSCWLLLGMGRGLAWRLVQGDRRD